MMECLIGQPKEEELSLGPGWVPWEGVQYGYDLIIFGFWKDHFGCYVDKTREMWKYQSGGQFYNSAAI